MAKKQEATRVLNSHKNAMKKAVAASKGGAKKCGTVKNTNKMEAVLETVKLPKAPRKPPVLQGRRRIPTPGDGHGCRHRGLRELDPCTKVWIGAYVKVGAWLHKKPCFDCANRGEVEGTRERVLDASVLLRVRELNVAFICNCGPIGHKMMDDDDDKEDYNCDMMLCGPCYKEREMTLEGTDGSRRRNKRKTCSY